MPQIQVRTNSASDIILASIKKLNKSKKELQEEKILKKQIERKEKNAQVEKEMFETLKEIENPFHRISYMKKRLVMQNRYLANIKGKISITSKIVDIIRVLNRKNSKPIRKKITTSIIEQKIPYKYEVNSRKVLKDLIKYLKDNRSIFEDWSNDVQGQIKKSKMVLKEIRNDNIWQADFTKNESDT